MKNILFITMLIIGMSATYSLAQMGHGMMRGGHMTEEDGHMMDQNGMMHDKEYKQLDDIFTRKQKSTDEMPMQHRQVMNEMMAATQDLAIMMRQLSVMMGNITEIDNKASEQNMQGISVMMKDMAMEMNRISEMMGQGTANSEEVKAMQDRMIKIQGQMWELNR